MNEKERSPVLPQPPAGLETLYSKCRELYPDQTNPLQVTAILKYWLGGPDPLDYISMYANPGNIERNIPPHWHYISFGLSDLHGDGRVHELTNGPENISGLGFELTFRLKREPQETAPPTWPAALLQSLAKYVFQSGNRLCAGDHVSWHCALDNSESRLQHMLMALDAQLIRTQTPFGSVDFVQVVGVCAEELQAGQKWLGEGVLHMLRRHPGTGGPWLVTDMRRGESIFELDPTAQEEVERGFDADGSNLSGVSARCSWIEIFPETRKDQLTSSSSQKLSEKDSDEIRSILERGLHTMNRDIKTEPINHTHIKLEGNYEYAIKRPVAIHITFNLEAGNLLPLAIRGRVKHGRHFTFKSILDDTVITLVAESVTGTQVSLDRPYALLGGWLQVLVPDELVEKMDDSFDMLSHPEKLSLPKTFTWPEHHLSITIISDVVQSYSKSAIM